MKNSMMVFVALLFLSACGKENPDPTIDTQNGTFCTTDNRFTATPYFSDADIESMTDIPYGNAVDWQGNATELLFDAYFPNSNVEDLAARPAVLIMHGGSFQFGNKEQWRSTCIEFAKRGFVTFSLNYRLGWDRSRPSDQVRAIYLANQDARAAVRYIVANATDFKIDPDWLFIGGGSAGSVNALNTIYLSQSEWNETFPEFENTYGNLNTSGNDLTNTYAFKGVFNNWGGVTVGQIQTRELVPMVSFHGALDEIVPLDEGTGDFAGSRVIHNLLTANNICSDLTVDVNGGHGVYTNEQGTAFRVSKASCFFKNLMCENCNSVYAEEVIPPDCSN